MQQIGLAKRAEPAKSIEGQLKADMVGRAPQWQPDPACRNWKRQEAYTDVGSSSLLPSLCYA